MVDELPAKVFFSETQIYDMRAIGFEALALQFPWLDDIAPAFAGYGWKSGGNDHSLIAPRRFYAGILVLVRREPADSVVHDAMPVFHDAMNELIASGTFIDLEM